MGLVCFDTQVIIWGIKREATTGQEYKIEQAQYLIKTCDEKNLDVMIPSIVVAELLCGLDPSEQNTFRNFMDDRFIVSPFDTQAALCFAKMWRDRSQNKEDIEISRAEMKADYMIASIAVAKGAECIYSEDKGLKNFAQNYIEIRALPDVSIQMSFEDI